MDFFFFDSTRNRWVDGEAEKKNMVEGCEGTSTSERCSSIVKYTAHKKSAHSIRKTHSLPLEHNIFFLCVLLFDWNCILRWRGSRINIMRILCSNSKRRIRQRKKNCESVENNTRRLLFCWFFVISPGFIRRCRRWTWFKNGKFAEDSNELGALSFASMEHGEKCIFCLHLMSFAFIEIDLLCKVLVIQLSAVIGRDERRRLLILFRMRRW